ncbi:MAG: hypothetical protein FJ104_15510, partial [Deltaproteobacteria bacterium]|nr:hypothetical protein [Deltaproteobacteria bacterium]
DGEGGSFRGDELVGTAEVLAHREGHALAALSRGSDARDGDVARLARDGEQPSRSFPFRVVDVAEATLILRPIVHAGSPLGVGVLAEAEGTYLGQDYFAGVRLAPLGLGWSDRGKVIVTSALAEGGYDGAVLAAGLGLGVSWVAGNLDHMLESWGGSSSDSGGYEPGGPEITRRQPTNTALTLSQVARLGSRDGLHLSLRNLLLFHEEPGTGQNGFIYGGTTARLTIPVAELSDLQIEGGGGVMGYWMFGVGVGTWIRGNGGPGSWRLSLSAGAAGVHGSREVKETYTDSNGEPYTYDYDEDVDVAGPMVSAGITRRFEL